jgi:hypothetical protein
MNGQDHSYSTDHKMSQGHTALGILVLMWAVMILFPEMAYAGGGGGQGVPLDEMLINFVRDIVGPLGKLINVACYTIGAFLGVKALWRLTKNEQGAKAPEGMGTIMTFIVAGVMMAIPVALGTMDTTLFGSIHDSSAQLKLSYDNTDAEAMERANNVLRAILAFVQLIGLLGFVRGFLMLRQVADGAAQTSSTAAYTHIIGGTLAWNIDRFVLAVEETLKVHLFGSGA